MQVPSFALSPLLSWLECVLAFTLKFLSQLSMNALCFKIIFSEQISISLLWDTVHRICNFNFGRERVIKLPLCSITMGTSLQMSIRNMATCIVFK